ncbi:MAG: hypothetical protein J6B75_02035 [Ruminococcus sp.]|nr:hypothetical protein [Ruminococcus sp.]
MRESKDTYKEVRTLVLPGCIITMHIPDISAEERKRRMEQIGKAAESLLKDVMRRQAHGEEKSVLQST